MVWLLGARTERGNLEDHKLKGQIDQFVGEYIGIFQTKLRERNYPPGLFSFGKPTNHYFFIDKYNIHWLYTSQFASNVPAMTYIDLRSQEKAEFSLEELRNWLVCQEGITETVGITFDPAILTKSPESRASEIEQWVDEHIMEEYKELVKRHQPLFISREHLEKFLDLATEDEFINVLLIPLFRHIGFKSVEAKGHTDRSLEFGQDIRSMKIQLPTGHWLYFSAQVKKGDIKGETRARDYIEKVLSQTRAQLEWEMFDSELGVCVKPDHVLLIVSGQITESARQYISRHELTRNRRLLLLDRERIIRLCEEYGLPENVQLTIRSYSVPGNPSS